MRHAFLIATLVALAAVPAAAQGEFRWEQSDALKVRFKVHNKVFPIPLKLGGGESEVRMQFEPKDPGDYIYGRYGAFKWEFVVLEFPKANAASKPATGKPGAAVDEDGDRGPASSFVQWVTERDRNNKDRTFAVKGKEMKPKAKAPAWTWWEYTDKVPMTNGAEDFEQLWYNTAAVYSYPDRDVALVARIPVKKGTKPDPKHMKWMETMCQSVETIAGDDGDSVDTKRDQYANSEERKQDLERAKANIANLKGWDYFTTPNFIVLYSWNPEQPAKRNDSLKLARYLSDNLEEMRELYQKDYPPHDKQLTFYSVLRICDSYDEFRKYGDTPAGVIGWFNPRSLELVVFDDKQNLVGGDKNLLATVFHEGWHQYGCSYFGLRIEDDAAQLGGKELHRWFDEGTGDYYGGFTRAGKSWKYAVDKGRKQSIRAQVARGTFIPVAEIINWNKDKFYGPRAPDHYAQGYAIVDFLRRGKQVLGAKFDDRWDQVLEIYRATMLETKDQKQAVKKAFEGIDMAAFEAQWVEWVKTQMN